MCLGSLKSLVPVRVEPTNGYCDVALNSSIDYKLFYQTGYRETTSTFLNQDFHFADLTCGSNIYATSTPQTIQSPNWPKRYGNLEHCEWVVIASTPGYTIRINFLTMDTELGYDMLEVSCVQ